MKLKASTQRPVYEGRGVGCYIFGFKYSETAGVGRA